MMIGVVGRREIETNAAKIVVRFAYKGEFLALLVFVWRYL